MIPSDQLTGIAFRVLEDSRHRRRQSRGEVTGHGVTLEQLPARTTAAAPGGVSASPKPTRYVLTDCSGENYWNGKDFVLFRAGDHAIADYHCFRSYTEAQAAAAGLREEGKLHLLVRQVDA